MRTSRLTRVLALALAASQLVAPAMSQAATTYQMRKAVPSLMVVPSSASSPGSSGNADAAGRGSLSATGLDFSSVLRGQTSSAQTLVLTNVGSAALTLTAAPSTTGDFSATTDCGGTLAVNASCLVSVTFQPTTSGAHSGLLSVPTAAGAVTATLSGTGIVPLAQAAWESTTLDFGGVPVNTTLSKTVKLFNEGNVPGSWSSLPTLPAGVTADASTCSSVAPAQSCTVSFTYAPTTSAAYSATGIAPSMGTASNSLSITGQGLTTQVGLSAGSLALADTDVGATSLTRSVQVANLGNAVVSMGALTVSGPFAAATNCGSSLAVGASCQVNVTFSPTVMGSATGSLTLGTGAGAQTVDLSGMGLQASGSLSVTSLDWASFAVGSTAATKTAVVTNTGNKALSLGTPTVSGSGFAVSTTCGASLAAGASCNLNVDFVPPATGSFSGSVSLSTSASTLALSLTGAAAVEPVTLSSFVSSGYEWVYRQPSVAYPTAQALCAGTINTTTGWQVPSLAALTAMRADMTASGLSTLGWPMAAATWYWTSDVYQTGANYVLNDTAQSFLGSGNGSAAALACARPVAAAFLYSSTYGLFGAVTVGSTVSQPVKLTNTGALGLNNIQFAVQGAGVSITANTCTSTLASGSDCTVTVTWAPAASGSLSGASVSVTSSAANGTQTVPLTGSATVDPSLVDVSFLMRADTSLADNSTTGLTVTAYGDAAVGTSLRKEGAGALALDGTGDYVTTSSSTALGMGTGDFTMEAWVYMNGSQASSATALDMRAPGGSTQVKPTIMASGGTLSFYVNGWQPTGMTVAPGLNAWHHVAYSRSRGIGRFFVNGVQRGSDLADANNYGTSADLVIGQVGDNRGYSAGYFKGAIDEVRITKGVGRYTSGFTPVANGDPYASNDILLVNGESGTNAAPTNLAPSGVTLSVGSGSPTLSSVDKRFGSKSLSLAGSTYVSSASAVTFGTADLTLEGWFKPSNAVTGSTYSGFIGTGTANGLTFYIGNGAIRYALQNQSSVVLVSASATAAALTPNVWHHVALTRTASDKTLRVFIDGALVGSLVLGTNPSFATQNIVIGGDTPSTGLFTGYIDDVRVSAGVARYQAAFTVPSTGLTETATTVSVGGYTWSRPTAVLMTSAGAATYCSTLGVSGGGWRLPTKGEAGAVYSSASNRAVLVAAGWPNTTWAWMWTSTAYSGSANWVWRTDATSALQGLANSNLYESFAPFASVYPVSCVK